MPFRDRTEAGRELAQKLKHYSGQSDVIVLALPRGGVPVGYEVAFALGVALDVFLVRKLGLPGREELAMGAIASGGVRVLNDDVINSLNVSPQVIESVTEREQGELAQREQLFRDNRPLPELRDRTVLLIDDGLATGSTMRAAVESLRQQHPSKIVVAVPVGAVDTCREFERLADEVVCARTPEPFLGVGVWYRNFTQTSDDEVRELLARNAAQCASRTRQEVDY